MEENEGKNVETSATKTFTQEQVNNLIKERLDRVYKRYGVENREGLDDLISKALSYEEMNEKFTDLENQVTNFKAKQDELQAKLDETTLQNQDLTKKHAFMSKNINPELYNDIEMYFKGKGLDINETTLDEELKTHSSWCKPGVIQPLGQEYTPITQPDEKELASKIFGVEF